MALDKREKQQLMIKAHKLKPVVMISSKGFTDNVKKEIINALLHHELIKVRISGAEREDKKQAFVDICNEVDAELIQMIGNIGVLYKKNLDKA